VSSSITPTRQWFLHSLKSARICCRPVLMEDTRACRPARMVKKKAGQPQAKGAAKQILDKVDKLTNMIPRGTFAALGGQIAGPIGTAIGTGISKITGRGSYQVSHNTLQRQSVMGADAQNIPTFAPSEHGSRVRHREFIGNIISPPTPEAFNNTSYRLAVDNKTLFPWLAELAARYQKVKYHGMVFYYKTTSTDYNNSGTVQLAVNYNATEEEYTSTAQMLNSMFSTSTKPSVSAAAPIECDPSTMPKGGYYIRHPLSINSETDLRMSTVGTLNVATEGLTLPSGTVLGQLWCTYDVELLYPYVVPSTIVATSFTTCASVGYKAGNTFSSTLDEYLRANTRGSIDFPFELKDYVAGTSGGLDPLTKDTARLKLIGQIPKSIENKRFYLTVTAVVKGTGTVDDHFKLMYKDIRTVSGATVTNWETYYRESNNTTYGFYSVRAGILRSGYLVMEGLAGIAPSHAASEEFAEYTITMEVY